MKLPKEYLRQKIIWFILLILTYLGEFEGFLKNSKNEKLEVLCAITFGGIAMHLKVIGAFKLQETAFFED